MARVTRIIVALFAVSVVVVGLAQNTSEKLKKEQDRLESKIANTKSLLAKSKSNTATSLNELRVIENQILYRERLLKNYDDQIHGAELTVQLKEQQIVDLKQKIELLKEQYRKLLIYAYKHRDNYGKMMYIFTSDSYNEARKRNKYLQRLSDVQLKQFLVIVQNQKLIKEEIATIQKERDYKIVVIEEKKRERKLIASDKEKKEVVYQKFKLEEDGLLGKLKEEERQKEVLRSRINSAIQSEIAATETRRNKEAAEAKRREAATATTTTTAPTAPKTVAVDLAETKELALVGQNFEGNRGKLPWPVDKGSITENFGKNPHPTLKNVYTNNRGIDISAPQNSQVRAVFDGEVTSVLNIPGAGKVVIIKHGNYRTVYSNLQDTYVKIGSKVNTKKVIGSLLSKNGETLSVVHFEIHKVSGVEVTCLNPTLWVAH
jgi:septal ring factor EnvC (AmiA/AmiB activator)